MHTHFFNFGRKKSLHGWWFGFGGFFLLPSPQPPLKLSSSGDKKGFHVCPTLNAHTHRNPSTSTPSTHQPKIYTKVRVWISIHVCINTRRRWTVLCKLAWFSFLFLLSLQEIFGFLSSLHLTASQQLYHFPSLCTQKPYFSFSSCLSTRLTS